MRYALVNKDEKKTLISVDEIAETKYEILYHVYDSEFKLFLEINAPAYVLSQSGPKVRYRNYLKELRNEINELNAEVGVRLKRRDGTEVLLTVKDISGDFTRIFPGEEDMKGEWHITKLLKEMSA